MVEREELFGLDAHGAIAGRLKHYERTVGKDNKGKEEKQ
jgi:hypothetical protein